MALRTLGLNEVVTQNPASTIPYEELVESVQTFGRLYLPSVYGKDLSSFEIASSGKIVLSLNDQHAVDIIEAETMVFVKPAAENSIQVALLEDLAHVSLVKDGQYVDIASATSVYVMGSEAVQIGTSEDLAIISLHSSNLYLTSAGTLAMSTANQQAYVAIDTERNDVNIYSSNDCTIFSNHEVIIKANALRIQVDELDIAYTFRPTSTGSLTLIQSIPDPVTGIISEVQVAKFGIPAIL